MTGKFSLEYGTIMSMGVGGSAAIAGAAMSETPDQVSGSIIGGTGDILLDLGAEEMGKHINRTKPSEVIKNQLLKEAQQLYPDNPEAAKKIGENLLKIHKSVNVTQAKNAVKTAKTALVAAKETAKKAASTAAKTGATAAAKSLAAKTAGIVAAKQLSLATARITATAAALAPTGPIGWIVEAVLFIVQMAGMAIDMTWNPLQTYFNKDLDDLKKSYDDAIRKQGLEQRGQEYPLELKPNVIPMNDDEHEEFNKYLQEYYINNKLVFPEEADKVDQLYNYLDYLKRERHVLYNPLKFLVSTQHNISLLAAAAIRKQYNILGKAMDIKKPSQYKPVTDWLSLNWQLVVIICCSLCISVFFIFTLGISQI